MARFMGPTWGSSGADRTQVGPMLVPWTLPSGLSFPLKIILIKRGDWHQFYAFICYIYKDLYQASHVACLMCNNSEKSSRCAYKLERHVAQQHAIYRSITVVVSLSPLSLSLSHSHSLSLSLSFVRSLSLSLSLSLCLSLSRSLCLFVSAWRHLISYILQPET